jgi:hypothetical protein
MVKRVKLRLPNEQELKAIVRCCRRSGDQVAEQSAMVTLADLQAKHAKSAKAKATNKDLQLKRPASKVKVAPIQDNTQSDPGKPDLAAKVARLLSQADPSLTPMETLDTVKYGLSHNEIRKIYGQRKTAAVHGDVAANRYDDAVGKGEKCKMALAWFIERKAGCPAFTQLVMMTNNAKRIEIKEKWRPKTFFLQEFGEDEFQQHLASGRFQWRECARTKGVYEYQDTEDQVTVTIAQQHKRLDAAQEKDDEEDELMAIVGTDVNLLIHDQRVWNSVQAAIGDGKGTPKNKCKGTVKSQHQRAITNDDHNVQDETADEALDRMRKMNSLIISTKDMYNELITRFNRINNKVLSRDAMVSADAQINKMSAMSVNLTKIIMSTKKVTIHTIRKEILAAAELYKTAQIDMKAYKHILNDKAA